MMPTLKSRMSSVEHLVHREHIFSHGKLYNTNLRHSKLLEDALENLFVSQARKLSRFPPPFSLWIRGRIVKRWCYMYLVAPCKIHEKLISPVSRRDESLRQTQLRFSMYSDQSSDGLEKLSRFWRKSGERDKENSFIYILLPNETRKKISNAKNTSASELWRWELCCDKIPKQLISSFRWNMSRRLKGSVVRDRAVQIQNPIFFLTLLACSSWSIGIPSEVNHVRAIMNCAGVKLRFGSLLGEKLC